MTKSIFTFALFAVLTTAIGLAVGYYTGREASTTQATATDPSEPSEHAEMTLDAQTLADLGVVIGTVQSTKPRHTTRLQARIVDTATTTRVVTAPFAGRVRSIDATLGAAVDAATPVITVVRDRLPPFEPKRAATILRPVYEELHDAYADLLSAHKKREVLTEQIERFDRIDAQGVRRELESGKEQDLPLVARQRLIDLRNELRLAIAAYEGIEHKLIAHGLSRDEVDRVLAGGHPPHGSTLWKRALEHHGLWTNHAAAVHAVLPQPLRDDALSIAAIGELSAVGLLDEDFVAAVQSVEALRSNFLALTRLVLDGVDVDRAKLIAASGGLAATMRLVAPSDDAARSDGVSAKDRRFDVVAYHVAIGQHVEAGTVLATLRDASKMHLEVLPVGAEVTALRALVEARGTFSAEPAVEGSGPRLDQLVLRSLGVMGDDASATGNAASGATNSTQLRALAHVDNSVVTLSEDGARTWALLPGVRYVAEVTIEREGDPVFVLPHEAVVRQGPARTVLVMDQDHVHPHKVHVVDSDDRFVYVARGVLEEGDKVVIKGALALSLALERSGGGADHGHEH